MNNKIHSSFEFTLDTFNNSLNVVCTTLLEYGKKGYTIPNIDNVKFTDPSVTILQVWTILVVILYHCVLSLQDCVRIGMDFVYT